jgi:uncharacterized protein YchJ
VNTIEFIRARQLGTPEVRAINYLIKARAHKFVAAGRKEWLFPEREVHTHWREIAHVLGPPKEHLHHFGGEISARFESGEVHYQDAFGRREPEREFLKKSIDESKLQAASPCGCGSGRAYKDCCKTRPGKLRRSWSEASVRERNLALLNGITDTLSINDEWDWVAARRELSNDRIVNLYQIFASLWSTETDLLSLLPKPDGRHRAVYAGPLHPETIGDFALAAPLYFGEVLIEHPFIHPRPMKSEFSPIEKPGTYQQEIIKALALFIVTMPLVDAALIDLVPDPGSFDQHLHWTMLKMAKTRGTHMRPDQNAEPRLMRLMEEDAKRVLLCLPDDLLRRDFRDSSPGLEGPELEEALRAVKRLREQDPYAPLRDDVLERENGGQFMLARLAPNFEMALYLAQATGASLITDSPIRWAEWRAAQRAGPPLSRQLRDFTRTIARSRFLLPRHPQDVLELQASKLFQPYQNLFADLYRYVRQLRTRGTKPNFEAQLTKRFERIHAVAQNAIGEMSGPLVDGHLHCLLAPGGLQHNTVNRLLLMSNSEAHLDSVPMGFFFEIAGARGKPHIFA